MWPKLVPAISVHYDSQSAIGRAQSHMYNGKSRHIRRRHNVTPRILENPSCGEATTFTLQNKCKTTVWPGFQSGSGRPKLMNGGIQLNSSQSIRIVAPTGWSGRFWGRTRCSFDHSGTGNCATGDCAGLLDCAGAGGAPPATLAEFTLHTPLDFYDVSLVDGFNIPISIVPVGSGGARTNMMGLPNRVDKGCESAGCLLDLNEKCPDDLKVVKNGRVVACKSACLAFGRPEFCCTEAYNSPNICKPSNYSEVFKGSCPQAYSYAYDDTTSIFTCQGSDYVITFC